MSKETETNLANWESNERDYCDDLYKHFNKLDIWDWCDIADESRRIWNLMFKTTAFEVQPGSPIDGVLSATAAAGAQGVWKAVAAAFGLDADDMQVILSEWYENQNALPDPISMEECKRRIEEWKTEKETWTNPNLLDIASLRPKT